MRGQIRGLDQATRNAQDGVSMIQTAEGALNEVSDMLTRMKELAVQKLNGTYSSDDTANIDSEALALGTAIDEILTSTKFNGIAVFTDGATIAYGEDGSLTLDITAASFIGGLNESSDVTTIEDAITAVNTDRAAYGAMQNQLEHVINNLGTTGENCRLQNPYP
jgi:flagellin